METRRVLRQERKFSIHAPEHLTLKARLQKTLREDKHNGSDGYFIRSLYFDTLDDRDFREKMDGIELRRKIRLRMYDPDSPVAYLEMKQKQGSYQLKRSLPISREDALRLTMGDYHPLLHYKQDFAAECYGALTMHSYRPKIIIEYQRTAFYLPENDIRITFDHTIQATSFCGHFFEKKPIYYPVIHPASVVLEVKYQHFLLSYIKDALATCNKSETAISKYVLARQRAPIF